MSIRAIRPLARWSCAACVLIAAPAAAQTATRAPRPEGRVSFYVTTIRRAPEGVEAKTDSELATALTFATPDVATSGFEARLDVRHTNYSAAGRPQRLSLYDGYAGIRMGNQGRFRVRAGHMWLPDLGTSGALAGVLAEFHGAQVSTNQQLTAGVFAGAEPLNYQAGYASGVKKFGGYVALQSGFLRRHVVGLSSIRQRSLTERSVLTMSNYVPAGRSFFAYQALEYDLSGPANGAARGGLSYFMVNARQSLGSSLELQGTFNRGRSLDARQLGDDVLNGRPLTTQAVEGLRYQTAGGRVRVRVTRQIELHAGYARDRNNRDDASSGRLTVGGYSSNLLGSGVDVAASDARIDRPTGSYHSSYLSLGHSIGRSWYVSGDFSTSLSVVRFLRSDGVTIETRPRTRRLSGNVSATLSRHFSLLGIFDYTFDDTGDKGYSDMRIMTGLTYRLR